jgi:hypothetical protein
MLYAVFEVEKVVINEILKVSKENKNKLNEIKNKEITH